VLWPRANLRRIQTSTSDQACSVDPRDPFIAPIVRVIQLAAHGLRGAPNQPGAGECRRLARLGHARRRVRPDARQGAAALSRGRASIDGGVKRFKKGAPILAQHLGVPIVPVALRGVFELWPRTQGVNWRLVAPWSGHRVRIAIGPPLTVADGESYAPPRRDCEMP